MLWVYRAAFLVTWTGLCCRGLLLLTWPVPTSESSVCSAFPMQRVWQLHAIQHCWLAIGMFWQPAGGRWSARLLLGLRAVKLVLWEVSGFAVVVCTHASIHPSVRPYIHPYTQTNTFTQCTRLHILCSTEVVVVVEDANQSSGVRRGCVVWPKLCPSVAYTEDLCRAHSAEVRLVVNSCLL